MKYFFTIAALGSLWGFVEIMPWPKSIFCILGVLFLAWGRRVCNVPGSSLAMGLIACLYKTYSVNFFLCQWVGVLSLSLAFDCLATLVWREKWRKPIFTAVVGALTNLLAMVFFVAWAIFIAQQPYWVKGGLEHVAEYFWETVSLAMGLSMLAAPLGSAMSEKLQLLWGQRSRFAPHVYGGVFTLSWSVAILLQLL